jgi:hypothetical protein
VSADVEVYVAAVGAGQSPHGIEASRPAVTNKTAPSAGARRVWARGHVQARADTLAGDSLAERRVQRRGRAGRTGAAIPPMVS